jgi:hypothetical protein
MNQVAILAATIQLKLGSATASGAVVGALADHRKPFEWVTV